MLPPYVLVYAFKGQANVFEGRIKIVSNSSNIEIFLYILILKTLTCDPFTWLCNEPLPYKG